MFKECVRFSIALDESTDVKDNAQLLIFFRGITKDYQIVEELIEMRTMIDTIKGNSKNTILMSLFVFK